MSLDGSSYTFVPYTINGINNLATTDDIANCVKYSNNTSNTNLDTYDLTTSGTIASQNFAIPDTASNNESWITYTLSTMGNLSSLGGIITTDVVNGRSMYFTGGVLGSPGFKFETLGSNAGKVICTNENSVFSTTINAGQLEYITGLTSQAGGVGQNNTWTGTNTFTTLTDIASIRITSSISNSDFSLSVNAYSQLEFTNLTTHNLVKTDGNSFWIPGNIYSNSIVYSNDLQLSNAYYFAYGTGQQWGTTLNGSGEYEIQDDGAVMRLQLSKSSGLTVSSINITEVPIASPSPYTLGLDGNTVIKYIAPSLGGNNTWSGINTFSQPLVMNGLSVATPTYALGINGSNQMVEFAVPTAVNLLPLNNTWTGTNTFNNNVSLGTNTVVVSPQSTLTPILQTAGLTAMTTAGVITYSAPTYTLTPSPSTFPIAGCYTPTGNQGISLTFNFTANATYQFQFTNFLNVSGIFGVNLTIYQANVADNATIAISSTYPVVNGTFTGTFTPNINPSYLGQVYLQFTGINNKSVSWTAFTYVISTEAVNGNLTTSGQVGIGTTQPQKKIHAYVANGGDEIRMSSSNMDIGMGINTPNNSGFLYVRQNYPLVFGTNNNERMRISNTGNVSIGTSDTTYQFNLVGTSGSVVSYIRNLEPSGYVASYWGTDTATVGVIFKNGSTRSADGGVNTMTVRNDGGSLRLQNNSSAAITLSGNDSIFNGNILKLGSTSGIYSTWVAGDATNAPFHEYYAGGLRRMYIGYSNATDNYIIGENNTYLNLGTNGAARLKISPNGECYHQAGDASYIKYGSNATWGAYLTVGATPDKSGAANAQVITTNGNLHLDGGNNNEIYYGYYTFIRGTPNYHRFYGSASFQNDVVLANVPQATSQYSRVLSRWASTVEQSQCLTRQIYRNESVAWAGGINFVNAFYKYNAYTAIRISGYATGYTGGATFVYPSFRLYSQSAGTYTYYQARTFTNIGSNHVSYPFDQSILGLSLPNSGWYDLYFYSQGGLFTDGNDALVINVAMFPGCDF